MEKLFFAVYLNPNRPDFATTMSDEEKMIMFEHIEFWTKRMNEGKVYAFGPVMEPSKVYGLGIVAVQTEEELKEFIANDPASKINTYTYFPMRAVVPKLDL